MYRSHVIRAWKWLLAYLVIAASVGYLFTLLLVGLGVTGAASLLSAATFGLRHVGIPIISQGSAFGVDPGLMIFFCNLTVALLLVSLAYGVRLLNPNDPSRDFLWLRGHLQKDLSAGSLRKIPIFSHIISAQLCLTSFLLLGVPLIATLVLGFMAGSLFGIAHLLSSSPLTALAYLLPHGLPEVAALLLACSLPVATWLAIRPVVDNKLPDAAFRRIDRVLASRQLQQKLKMIVNLLLIAGLIEAHFTHRVVAMISGG